MKPKEVQIIKAQITHRNDSVRIIDSAVAMQKQRVHKLSKRQIKEEFDSVFVTDTTVVHDTMVVTVEQVKKCLERDIEASGDSAKLAVDDKTLAIIDDKVDSLHVEQPRDYKGMAIGVGVGVVATLLLILGVK